MSVKSELVFWVECDEPGCDYTMWLNRGRKHLAAPKPQPKPDPPKPRQWEPPTDLTDEQMEWLRIQMDLAGQPMPKPPPPRKASLVNPYRKPSSGEYVEVTAVGDKRRTYISTGRS